MADGTLIFDTKIDESGLNSGLKSAGDSANQAGSMFSSALGVLTGNLMTQAVNGLVKLGKQAIQTGMDFETGMSQIGATLGYSVEELNDPLSQASADMEKLTEKAKEMGSTTKFTATESAEALNILAMSGFNAEESIEMVDDVLNLAAAGTLDMASSATYLGGAMKGFGDKTKKASYYADLMAKGATKANTNVNQLGEALSDASSTASGYGQSAESVTVALLELAEQNVTGSAAATMLNRAMADLYTPTDQAASALEELGVSAYYSSGKAKDFNDLVRELESALAGMSEEQKNAYLNTIFTTNGLQAFNKITSTSVEKEQEFAEALADANGAAATQADVMQDNLEGKVTALGSAFDGMLIAIYDWLDGPLKDAAEFATNIINGITELISPQKSIMEEFIDDIKKINDGAEAHIENSRKAMDNATYDVGKLEAYKEQLLKLNGAESLNVYEKYALKSIVDKLSEDIPELADAWDNETESLNLTNDQLERMFQDKEALIMQEAWEEARTEAYEGLADATVALNMAQAEQSTILSDINDILGTNYTTIEDVVDAYADMDAMTEENRMDIEPLISNYAKLNSEVDRATEEMDAAKTAVEQVDAAQQHYEEQLKSSTESTEEHINSTDKLIDALGAGLNAVGEIASGIDDQQGSLIDLFTSVVAEAHDAAEEEAEASYDIGEYLVEGMSDGVDSAADDLVASAISAVAAAWNAMCDWLDIASPSKKAKRIIGRYWAEGIGIGFSDTMEDQSVDMTGSIEDAFNDMQNAVYGMEAGNIGSGMVSPINTDVRTTGFDYNAFRDIIVEAVSRMAVNIDGQRAGDILTDYIDENLGKAYEYYKGGVW